VSIFLRTLTIPLTLVDCNEENHALADNDRSLSKADELASKYIPFLSKFSSASKSPSIAGNLVTYTLYVQPFQHGVPDSKVRYNDGKLNPSKYGSIMELDLRLCYEAFFTMKPCRFGNCCRWRHGKLADGEIAWMRMLGTKSKTTYVSLSFRSAGRNLPSLNPRRGFLLSCSSTKQEHSQCRRVVPVLY
jgi:hypothetical protein